MNSENSMLFPLFIGETVNNYHSQKNPICPPPFFGGIANTRNLHKKMPWSEWFKFKHWLDATWLTWLTWNTPEGSRFNSFFFPLSCKSIPQRGGGQPRMMEKHGGFPKFGQLGLLENWHGNFWGRIFFLESQMLDPCCPPHFWGNMGFFPQKKKQQIASKKEHDVTQHAPKNKRTGPSKNIWGGVQTNEPST